MNFEIRDGKEDVPPEEDIYGVNDAEEREQFEVLLGIAPSQETRLRRRKLRLRILCVVVAAAFLLVFAIIARNCWL